jgi:hypothetical protein
MQHLPITGESAWKAADFAGSDQFICQLEARHYAAFDAALARNAEVTETESIGREDFSLEAITDDVSAWRDSVENGRGFVLLRGFDAERYSEDQLIRIYWGIGTHFGRAVSQSSMGDRIGHVVDVGGKDQRERAYRNSRELTLHTDRCDVIGMLCLQKAWQGGLSGYTSAHSIYNTMLDTDPDLIEPLFAGYHYHRFGEQAEGEPSYTPDPVPIFSTEDGVMSVVFLRVYMEMAAKEKGEPLPDDLVRALDRFEALAASDELKLSFMLQPGDAIFFNNCVMLHHRTGFEDHSDPARKRHLVRLWLMDDNRPLSEPVRAYKGKAGVAAKDRPKTYYTGSAVLESSVR